MAQGVSRRPVTGKARLWSQFSPCEIPGGPSGTLTSFLRVLWASPVPPKPPTQLPTSLTVPLLPRDVSGWCDGCWQRRVTRWSSAEECSSWNRCQLGEAVTVSVGTLRCTIGAVSDSGADTFSVCVYMEHWTLFSESHYVVHKFPSAFAMYSDNLSAPILRVVGFEWLYFVRCDSFLITWC
jgi:hypothetical protein